MIFVIALAAIGATLLCFRYRNSKTHKMARSGLILVSLALLVCFLTLVTPDVLLPKVQLILMLTDVIVLWTLLYQVYYPDQSRHFIFQMLKNAIRMTSAILAVLFLGVILFPKVSFNFFSTGVTQNVTGFGSGSEMNPGEISELGQSSEVAFRAKISPVNRILKEDELYWRGSTFTRTALTRTALSRTTDGLHWFQGAESSATLVQTPDSLIEQKILLEPRFNETIFALDWPVVFPRPESSARQEHSETALYHASSTLTPSRSEFLFKQKKELLQIPPRLDPRFNALVNTLSTDHPPLKIFASRLLKYYSEHFRKRLDPGTYKKDGAAEFFFSRREGFCEHFSGTFATLLRVAGYPSRVVMGFQGGEWNSFSKTWIVRDYHAHAWVEAWSDEDRAWIRFDPTRAVGPFDPPHESQNEFLAYAEGVYTEWNYFYRSEEVEKHFRPSVGFGIVVFISLWLFRRIRKNQNKKDPAFRRFERYCKRLKKLGLERRPNEGPVDFLNRGLIFFANESEEFKNEMKQFTERYVRGRYRGDS